MSDVFLGCMQIHNCGEEVLARWKGVFKEPIYQVFQSCASQLGLERDAQEYLEALLVKFVRDLCKCKPHCPEDIEKQVHAVIPYPMNEWALEFANDARTKTFPPKRHKKMNLGEFAFVREAERLCQILKDAAELGYKVDQHVSMFILFVVQYLATDMLKLAINFVKRVGDPVISMKNMSVFFGADEIYHELFYQEGSDQEFWSCTLVQEPSSSPGGRDSYDSIVTQLLADETQFLRDLNLLIHVFHKTLMKVGATKEELEAIFGNICDIYEFSTRFIRSLEDTREMSENPTIGACFFEMAEGYELDVFLTYAMIVLNAASKDILTKLVNKPRVYELLENLCTLCCEGSADEEDLKQSQSLLSSLKSKLDPLCSAIFKKTSFINDSLMDLLKSNTPRLKTVQQVNKSLEIQKKIDGLDEIFLCYKYNVLDGVLGKVRYTQSKLVLATGSSDTMRRAGKTDRHVFLLDQLIILTKAITKKSTATNPQGPEFRLKEKIFINKARLRDRQDTDELGNSFEIVDNVGRPGERVFILFAKDLDEKGAWIAAILARKMGRILDRLLESYLKSEENRVVLKFPSPQSYRFCEPDSDDSIIYEDYTSSSGMPVVKGGTVLKLVERLTHHVHHDLKFVQTFLTTYRSFCSSSELLSLLIERFNIPTPSSLNCDMKEVSGSDTFRCYQQDLDPLTEQKLQRFRKEYARPVQIRVLSVMGKWVNQHWYDFQSDPILLSRLKEFLSAIMSHVLQKYIKAILSQIEKRQCETVDTTTRQGVSDTSTIAEILQHEEMERNRNGILWHLATCGDTNSYDIMTLHPIEIAKQITLLESELYRAVKPIELVGAAWMKKDKDRRSPQLLRLTDHSNRLTYYFEQMLIETKNLEERVSVVNRLLEISAVFEELNNFNGLMEIYSVLLSAAVFRLKWTINKIDSKLQKYYDRLEALFKDRHTLYKKRLREINPPCVPFFGMYLTNIFLMEEGNAAILRSTVAGVEDETHINVSPNIIGQEHLPIISFHKCRKIAEIIGEIQMYQNQPYNIVQEESIKVRVNMIY